MGSQTIIAIALLLGIGLCQASAQGQRSQNNRMGLQPPARLRSTRRQAAHFTQVRAGSEAGGTIHIEGALLTGTMPLAGVNVELTPMGNSVGGTATATTDTRGHFEVNMAGSAPLFRAQLRFAGDDLHLPCRWNLAARVKGSGAGANPGVSPAPTQNTPSGNPTGPLGGTDTTGSVTPDPTVNTAAARSSGRTGQTPQTQQVPAPRWSGSEPAVMEEKRVSLHMRVPSATLRVLSLNGNSSGWSAAPGTTFYWTRAGKRFAATELVAGNSANPSAHGIRLWAYSNGIWQHRDTSFDQWSVLLPTIAQTQTNARMQQLGLFDVFSGLFGIFESVGKWIKTHWPQLEAIWKDLKAVLKDAKGLIADVIKLTGNKSDQTGATATKAIFDTGQQGAKQNWLLSRRVAVGMYRVQGVDGDTINTTVQYAGGQ